MFAPVSIDDVGDAYHIAANYLKGTGRAVAGLNRGRFPIRQDVLANRAIARFEKINDVLEWVP
jgi:hypothetical protein